MPNYFVVYECPGGVCTWRGNAETPDQFIYSLLERKGDVEKITSLELEIDEWPEKPNKHLSVRKYNTWIRKGNVRERLLKQKDPGLRQQEINVMEEVSYRRGYHQCIACVIDLLESGATLKYLKQLERNLREWRSDPHLGKWVAYFNNPGIEPFPKEVSVFDRPEDHYPESDKGS